jgi:superfamily I DNA/RNA helicase
VEHQGADPARILAITFTDKAAIEIKQRLITRFAASPELREPIERAWVSTIHGFCARLLKEHSVAATS